MQFGNQQKPRSSGARNPQPTQLTSARGLHICGWSTEGPSRGFRPNWGDLSTLLLLAITTALAGLFPIKLSTLLESSMSGSLFSLIGSQGPKPERKSLTQRSLFQCLLEADLYMKVDQVVPGATQGISAYSGRRPVFSALHTHWAGCRALWDREGHL